MEPLNTDIIKADVEIGDDGDTKSAPEDDNSSDDEGASLKKKGEAPSIEIDDQSPKKVFISRIY